MDRYSHSPTNAASLPTASLPDDASGSGSRLKRFRPPSMHSLTSEAPARSRRREAADPTESVIPARAPVYSIRMSSSSSSRQAGQRMDASSVLGSPVVPPRSGVDSTGTEFPPSRSYIDSYTSHGSGRSAVGSLERSAVLSPERDALPQQVPLSPARREEPSRESVPSAGSLTSSITFGSSSRPPSWTRVPATNAAGNEGEEARSAEDRLTALLSQGRATAQGREGMEDDGDDDGDDDGGSVPRGRRRGGQQRAKRGSRRGGQRRGRKGASDKQNREEGDEDLEDGANDDSGEDDDGSWRGSSSPVRPRKQKGRKKRHAPGAASDDAQSSSGQGNDAGGKKAPKRWTKSEDQLLRQAVHELGERQWKTIASRVPGRNHVQCLQRWRKALAPGLKKGHWTEEEDDLLRGIVSQGFRNWGEAAAQIPGRTPKQCRERWRNHLDPTIKKSEWTAEEDDLLLRLYEQFSQSWARIAKEIEGRTENAVKIRWKTLQRLGFTSNSNAGSGRKSPPSSRLAASVSARGHTRGRKARGNEGVASGGGPVREEDTTSAPVDEFAAMSLRNGIPASHSAMQPQARYPDVHQDDSLLQLPTDTAGGWTDLSLRHDPAGAGWQSQSRPHQPSVGDPFGPMLVSPSTEAPPPHAAQHSLEDGSDGYFSGRHAPLSTPSTMAGLQVGDWWGATQSPRPHQHHHQQQQLSTPTHASVDSAGMGSSFSPRGASLSLSVPAVDSAPQQTIGGNMSSHRNSGSGVGGTRSAMRQAPSSTKAASANRRFPWGAPSHAASKLHRASFHEASSSLHRTGSASAATARSPPGLAWPAGTPPPHRPTRTERRGLQLSIHTQSSHSGGLSVESHAWQSASDGRGLWPGSASSREDRQTGPFEAGSLPSHQGVPLVPQPKLDGADLELLPRFPSEFSISNTDHSGPTPADGPPSTRSVSMRMRDDWAERGDSVGAEEPVETVRDVTGLGF